MNAQVNTDSRTTLELLNTDSATLNVIFKGSWRLHDKLPSIENVTQELTADSRLERITFSSDDLTTWDSGLLVFLSKLTSYCRENKIQVIKEDLPAGVRKLLDLASSAPETRHPSQDKQQDNLLSRIGNVTIDFAEGAPDVLHFLGASIKSVGRLFTGRAQYSKSDLLYMIQRVGPDALPIVSLISFLVGLILAYMGALQLERFGAQIYVADLVGIAMVREIGALMTAIIMAGRTGAAYAAELGTMQVNEEIDAFKTLGISTMDYLVMPRLLALVFTIPLLTLYAGLVGIFAGIIVGVTVFDLSVYEYYQQTLRALSFKHFVVGMMKGTLYGILIALAGCLRGMQCGRSAQAVGLATTSSVVTSIVYIVIAASLTTIILQKLGI
ncbi:MAG: ABC transporter permease [Gammaproteobacteria bacterium]|jgi:phospholipid/cholesterol/gamma-HCH transport system permease protein